MWNVTSILFWKDDPPEPEPEPPILIGPDDSERPGLSHNAL
jgi:hypothetical protein